MTWKHHYSNDDYDDDMIILNDDFDANDDQDECF